MSCLCICLSRCAIVSKWLNISSYFLQPVVAPSFESSFPSTSAYVTILLLGAGYKYSYLLTYLLTKVDLE